MESEEKNGELKRRRRRRKRGSLQQEARDGEKGKQETGHGMCWIGRKDQRSIDSKSATAQAARHPSRDAQRTRVFHRTIEGKPGSDSCFHPHNEERSTE
jgi:hypothetical protein